LLQPARAVFVQSSHSSPNLYGAGALSTLSGNLNRLRECGARSGIRVWCIRLPSFEKLIKIKEKNGMATEKSYVSRTASVFGLVLLTGIGNAETGVDAAAGRRLWLERGETPEQARRARTRRVSREELVDRRHFAFDDEADFDGDVEVPMACAIMLVRRSWFARARFDETLYRRSGFREETDFQIQLARLGARLIACPHAVCFHLPRREIGRQGGQRNGKLLRYEWSLLANDAAFRRRFEEPAFPVRPAAMARTQGRCVWSTKRT